jgi:hypothetical protein
LRTHIQRKVHEGCLTRRTAQGTKARAVYERESSHLRDSLVQIIVRVEQFEVVLLQRAREATRILVETGT